MANYYYFVPSLPAIRSDSESFMSVEDFLALCRPRISRKDYGILSRVALTDDVVKGNDFVEGYTRFRSMVNRELAWQRSQALGMSGDEYVNDGEKDVLVTSAVKKAVMEVDPLEGERILISLYFDYLDRNIGFGHEWDLTFLISYALKLQLLARRNAFTRDRGRAEFDSLFGQLRREIFE